jgi:hypothetical protein
MLGGVLMRWKPYIYKGEVTKYEVSDTGLVRNGDTLEVLQDADDGSGYRIVSIITKNGRVSRRVHRMVAETFIANPDNKPQVNHIDGNKSNNSVVNLEWVTAQENIEHAIDTGLFDPHHNYKLDDDNCVYTLEQLAMLYSMLKTKVFDFRTIADTTGIEMDIVSRIARGEILKEVSAKFGFDPDLYTKHTRKRKSGRGFYAKHYAALDKLIKSGKSSIEIMKLYPIPDVTVEAYKNMINKRRRILIADGKMDPLSLSNIHSTLNEEVVHAICHDLAENKMTMKAIGEKYNVNLTTIYNIKAKRIWREITTQYTFPKIGKQKDWHMFHDKIREMLESGWRPVDIAHKISDDPDDFSKVYGIIIHLKRKMEAEARDDA